MTTSLAEKAWYFSLVATVATMAGAWIAPLLPWWSPMIPLLVLSLATAALDGERCW